MKFTLLILVSVFILSCWNGGKERPFRRVKVVEEVYELENEYYIGLSEETPLGRIDLNNNAMLKHFVCERDGMFIYKIELLSENYILELDSVYTTLK